MNIDGQRDISGRYTSRTQRPQAIDSQGFRVSPDRHGIPVEVFEWKTVGTFRDPDGNLRELKEAGVPLS